jgi:broad specificity polyphosphatase/5'/3'-nucleotidase SurE
MVVLVTNDDGISSPGLLALHRALRAVATIVVAAPEKTGLRLLPRGRSLILCESISRRSQMALRPSSARALTATALLCQCSGCSSGDRIWLFQASISGRALPRKGVAITRLGKRIYRDELLVRHDPRGRPYDWIGRADPESSLDEGTDTAALANGYSLVTPIHFDLTNSRLLDELRGWNLSMGR